MKLRHIEVFHALMTSGNMTEAAAKLHVSQPAVSQVLKHAEQTLGLTLFQRFKGRLVPTPEARALLPEVDDIFARLEALDRTAQGLRNSAAGTVMVAAIPAIASFVLPGLLSSFAAKRPQSRIVLRVLSSSQAQSSVRELKSDFALIHQPGGVLDTTLQSEVLHRGEVTCVMPRRHALASRRSVSPADLASMPLITPGPQSDLGARIEASFVALGVPRNVRIESSSSLAAIFMVTSGLGVALVESTGMLDHFPDLVEREFRPHIETQVVLVTRSDRPKSRLAAAFKQHLSASLVARGAD